MEKGYTLISFTTIISSGGDHIRVELGHNPKDGTGKVEVSTLLPQFKSDVNLRSLATPSLAPEAFERSAAWYSYVVAEIAKLIKEGVV